MPSRAVGRQEGTVDVVDRQRARLDADRLPGPPADHPIRGGAIRHAGGIEEGRGTIITLLALLVGLVVVFWLCLSGQLMTAGVFGSLLL